MNSNQKSSGRFYLKQTVLLVVTIVLVILFTIPLLKSIKSALNPGELVAAANQNRRQMASLERKIDVNSSKILMAAGAEQVQEKLAKEVEALKRQMAAAQLENKYLQQQVQLTSTILELVKSKSASDVSPDAHIGFSQKVFDLLTKVFGCIASVCSCGVFLVSWIRNRRQVPPTKTS
ncbi:MAG: hypothetical protein WC647_18235 [Desulfomonilaceae bacterium]|jgi:predicted RND superfamily exporter protein